MLKTHHAEVEELMKERRAALWSKRKEMKENGEDAGGALDEGNDKPPPNAELIAHGRMDIMEWEFDGDSILESGQYNILLLSPGYSKPSTDSPNNVHAKISNTIAFPTDVGFADPKPLSIRPYRSRKKSGFPTASNVAPRKHTILRAWNASLKRKLSGFRKQRSLPSSPISSLSSLSPLSTTSLRSFMVYQDQNIPPSPSTPLIPLNEGETQPAVLPAPAENNTVAPARRGRPRGLAIYRDVPPELSVI